MPIAAIDLGLGGQSFLDSEGQQAGLILLASMLLSFGFIRFSTRMIRAEVSWWPGNIETGGIHIHHLVFGIVLMMLCGFFGFVLQPGSPLTEILAAGFGIGAGLTIDEFALWLHLEDVYWAEQGRSSVDAMIIATIVAGGFVLGLAPLGPEGSSLAIVIGTVVVNLTACAISALKGKVVPTLIGMFIPVFAYVAAIRLARPNSFWAKRYYKPGSEKLAEATKRDERINRRMRRIQDLVGGKPSIES